MSRGKYDAQSYWYGTHKTVPIQEYFNSDLGGFKGVPAKSQSDSGPHGTTKL